MQQLLSESFFNTKDLSVKGNKIAGLYAKADVVNENVRLYKYRLWDILLNHRPEFRKKLESRRVLGELGHPDIVDTTLRDVSHIVTALELQKNGDVYGESEILDTPSGRILRVLYEARVELGISSRGYLPEGVNLIPEGNYLVVPDEYELITFDFVIDPSSPGAFPKLQESVQTNLKTILTESRKYINKDVVHFITNYPKEDTVQESKDPSTKAMELLVPGYAEYHNLLGAIISELRDRCLLSESLISGLVNKGELSGNIVKNLSKRYITSEGIIKEFADQLQEVQSEKDLAVSVMDHMKDRYLQAESIIGALSSSSQISEEMLDDMTKRCNVLEASLEEMRDFALVAEGTVEQLKKIEGVAEATVDSLVKDKKMLSNLVEEISHRYFVAEAVASTLYSVVNELKQQLDVSFEVISSLRDKEDSSGAIQEATVKDLKSKVNQGKQELSHLKGVNEDYSRVIGDLRARYTLAEKVIASLQGDKGTAVPKEPEEPEEKYFEGVASAYRITVSEAKDIYHRCGRSQKAFEFFLKEKKRLLSRPYSEMPYMVDEEDEDLLDTPKSLDEEVEKISRLVARSL